VVCIRVGGVSTAGFWGVVQSQDSNIMHELCWLADDLGVLGLLFDAIDVLSFLDLIVASQFSPG
jgi:hypothetical protein